MEQKKFQEYGFLREVPLFRDLSDLLFKDLAEGAQAISHFKGSVILAQGAVAEGIYIIKSGIVEGAYWDEFHVKTTIVRHMQGDYFGDFSLFKEEPSLIGFRAIEDTELVYLPKSLFLDMVAVEQGLRKRVFRRIYERQAGLSEKMIDIKNRHASLKALMNKVEEEAPFLVGKTREMQTLWQKVPDLASDPGPLIIAGEFGVGKELLAEIIHSKGPLRNSPFIIIDASEVSQNGWQERFWDGRGEAGDRGLSKTPPSGVISGTRFGLLDLANGGTLLLKNIDALPLVLQDKLYRYLCDSLSANREGGLPDDDLPRVRMLFTTHRNLKEIAAKGDGDARLYTLLSEHMICLPPLRERKVDILDLALHFLSIYAHRYKKRIEKLSPRVKDLLLGYEYRRGNLEELEEIIERGVALASSDTLHSEQLFLGPAARPAEEWYNLLNIKPFGRMVASGLYPGIFKWIAVLFFFFVMVACFFGPQDPEKNWGTILVWWIWWPWLCLAAFWIGRTWCSFCAYGTIGNAFQKWMNLRLKFPKFLKDYDYIVTTALFLFVVWVEETTNMRRHPLYTGMLLLSILSLEVLFSVLFPRDTWCRYVCPMGNLIGVFAMTSIVEVRANLDICENNCSTHECYHGNGEIQGCPLFQHLVFLDNNQTCKLCLKCIRACPHNAASLNLRPPGREIWASNQVRHGMGIFVCALIAVLFPILRPLPSVALNTLWFFSAPLLVMGIMWTLSYIGFSGEKGRIYEGFWKTSYAYVPLALAGHIAYQLQYVPWVKDLEYIFLIKGHHLGVWPLQGLLQVAVLCLGLLFSFYAVIRIVRDKFPVEGRPNKLYWLGNIIQMTLYPVLIWYLLR